MILCSLWIFGHIGKRLDKNAKVNFQIYDVTNWIIKTIVIHILPELARSKGNQTMEFGQLIEYNMRNIFLENLCTKCGEETSPRSFFKNIKIEHISGSTVSSFTQCVYIVYPSRGLPKHIETKVLTTCF